MDLPLLEAQIVSDAARLGLALLLGAALGYDRERHNKQAGVRTIATVCVGSAVFLLVGLRLAESYEHADPARLAQAVAQGVGFLGAGVIWYGMSSGGEGGRSGGPRGLTTAATVWAAAAIGLACGAGEFSLAITGFLAAMLILIVLTAAKPILPKTKQSARDED